MLRYLNGYIFDWFNIERFILAISPKPKGRTSNWTTEEMLVTYKNIKAKSERIIELIDMELEK